MSDSPPDTTALESHLASELGAAVTGVETLSDGLNLVLAVSTPEREYVLRRPNELRDRPYIDELRDEYGVMERLHDTAIPTPEPVLYCDDPSILDGEFFVVPRVEGAVVPLGSDLPERFRHPDARRRLAQGLVDTLADVHALDTGAFGAWCDRRTPREQVAGGLDRLDEAAEVTGHGFPRLRALGEWLLDHAPGSPETAFVHGDFRPGNVLFGGDERPEIAAVLDWETALLGDPLTELGYLLLRWRDAGDPTPALDELEARYPDRGETIAELRAQDERGLAPYTADPGSPTRRELVARYEARTGRTFEHERFYRANAAFSLASVWVDLYRLRVAAGAAPEGDPHIEHMALVGQLIADGELAL